MFKNLVIKEKVGLHKLPVIAGSHKVNNKINLKVQNLFGDKQCELSLLTKYFVNKMGINYLRVSANMQTNSSR